MSAFEAGLYAMLTLESYAFSSHL